MSLFAELKRRNVFRVAFGYVVSSWLLAQVADLVLENIGSPDWVMQSIMLVLALGFPVAVFYAWAFEVTPEGIKREAEVDRAQSITHVTSRKLDRAITATLIVALGYFIWESRFREAGEQTGTGAASDPLTVQLTQDTEKESEPFLSAESATRKTEQKSALSPAPGQADEDVVQKQSVAVLPFINMSDDPENEYFSDGISEELLNVLVRVEGLRVPSRTSSFTFKGSNKKVTEIGRDLKVDHILEGSVRKANDRIRVTAQLIDVKTDTHLWSETYTRRVDDIFAVQDEIAQAIVDALKITLTGADRKTLTRRSTNNVEAYNKYLLGRHMWNQRSPESLLASTKPLREAVELDSEYDQAWAALADAYALIPEYGSGSI
jgi:TolB-like protein